MKTSTITKIGYVALLAIIFSVFVGLLLTLTEPEFGATQVTVNLTAEQQKYLDTLNIDTGIVGAGANTLVVLEGKSFQYPEGYDPANTDIIYVQDGFFTGVSFNGVDPTPTAVNLRFQAPVNLNIVVDNGTVPTPIETSIPTQVLETSTPTVAPTETLPPVVLFPGMDVSNYTIGGCTEGFCGYYNVPGKHFGEFYCTTVRHCVADRDGNFTAGDPMKSNEFGQVGVASYVFPIDPHYDPNNMHLWYNYEGGAWTPNPNVKVTNTIPGFGTFTAIGKSYYDEGTVFDGYGAYCGYRKVIVRISDGCFVVGESPDDPHLAKFCKTMLVEGYPDENGIRGIAMCPGDSGMNFVESSALANKTIAGSGFAGTTDKHIGLVNYMYDYANGMHLQLTPP